MANKISWPSYPLDSWSIQNDRKTVALDPEGVDLMTARLATGNRRLRPSQAFGRPKDENYDADGMWLATIRLPPYTKGLGLYGRGICRQDDDDPAANVAFYYKWQGGAWVRYLVFDQTSHGVAETETLDATTAYWLGLYLPFVWSQPNAQPNEVAVLSSPLPVTASNEAQDVVVEMKLETDLLHFYLLEWGFFIVPYDGEPYPVV